jgi:hypothetical protein
MSTITKKPNGKYRAPCSTATPEGGRAGGKQKWDVVVRIFITVTKYLNEIT